VIRRPVILHPVAESLVVRRCHTYQEREEGMKSYEEALASAQGRVIARVAAKVSTAADRETTSTVSVPFSPQCYPT
jgi:hypothetical protein